MRTFTCVDYMKETARRGARIFSLFDLVTARDRRQAVICPTSKAYRSPCPAAWMVNLTGATLHQLFTEGMWVYKPLKARKP